MTKVVETEPIWLTSVQIQMLHAEVIGRFGGRSGIRDLKLVESALGRAQHRWAYEERATLHDLATAYGFELSKNHAFVDGNKRVGALAIRAFLARNGQRFSPGDQAEMVAVFEGVASGAVDEETLARWIEANSENA